MIMEAPTCPTQTKYILIARGPDSKSIAYVIVPVAPFVDEDFGWITASIQEESHVD
jgi:hypothetical protein